MVTKVINCKLYSRAKRMNFKGWIWMIWNLTKVNPFVLRNIKDKHSFKFNLENRLSYLNANPGILSINYKAKYEKMRLCFSRTKGTCSNCLLNSRKPCKHRLVRQTDDIRSYISSANIFARTWLVKITWLIVPRLKPRPGNIECPKLSLLPKIYEGSVIHTVTI